MMAKKSYKITHKIIIKNPRRFGGAIETLMMFSRVKEMVLVRGKSWIGVTSREDMEKAKECLGRGIIEFGLEEQKEE